VSPASLVESSYLSNGIGTALVLTKGGSQLRVQDAFRIVSAISLRPKTQNF
jgi:hypothetical protein